jgi:hypothetical protein
MVSQESWGGGAMAFIIVSKTDEPTMGGERTAESFNGDETAAALLHIEYTTGGGGGGDGGMISIARSATGITLTFEGTLQESDSVTGPFTDVAGATSPAAIPSSGSGKFFRAQQ